MEVAEAALVGKEPTLPANGPKPVYRVYIRREIRWVLRWVTKVFTVQSSLTHSLYSLSCQEGRGLCDVEADLHQGFFVVCGW